MAANKKKATARHTEDTPVKSFLDMIAPSVVQFNPDHFICGNTFRCVWALREYPTQTDEQALLRHLGEKDGITLRIYTRQLTPAEEKRIIQNAANKNRMGSSNTNDLQQTITAESNLQDMISMEGSRHRNTVLRGHPASAATGNDNVRNEGNMDDIRNTSALFVGGQDTAPHTERTARELWQLLFQKTENEMAGYMNRLDQLSRDELIQAADEISAMMTCHSELMAFGENLSRKKMIFLLQQEKPLELLSEAWMEHQTVDVGETFQSLLTGLYDETRQTQVRDMVYAIQPKTIEELLTSYPDDYFQLMTPCGFVDLTPSETEKLLHGEATMAHPGVSGCQMPVEAQELLEMEVLSLKRDEHGCWYALTDHPQQKMEQAPQEPQML